MPQLTSDSPNVASSAAIARSHDTSGVNAPPKHQPLTIAIVGFGNTRSIRHCQSMLSRRTLRWTWSGAASTSRKYSLRSIPAENESPAPVSTSTAASSSASTSSSTSIISALSVGLIALRLSGRFSVTHAIRSSTSTSTVSQRPVSGMGGSMRTRRRVRVVLGERGGLGVVAAQPRHRVPGGGRRAGRPRRARLLVRALHPVLGVVRGRAGRRRDGSSRSGMDSLQRLRTIRDYGATTLLCTPTYAVHLARVAKQSGLADALATVERVVCTGEPGASIASVRRQIQVCWGARCLDHAGLSEVGSFAYPCASCGGMHLREDEFVAEILDPETGERVPDGATGELVVTALARTGFPVVRYRTGDVVEAHPADCGAGHPGRWLPQGILGRSDDMVVIRGMNVFPSAIEQILREFDGVGEFRITFYSDPSAMDEVKLEVELARPLEARAIQAQLRQTLGLRVRIVPLKPGILPTQIGKARRVADLRPTPPAAVRREG